MILMNIIFVTNIWRKTFEATESVFK